MKQFWHFLNKDSYLFGIILGICTPVVLYVFILGIVELIIHFHFTINSPNKLKLLATAGNLIWIRYYFVVKKSDNTGFAVLAITFILIISYFIFYK
ncbi:MAG: hypothetical protein WAN95_05920 [Bacteroidales bacterium]